MTDTLAVVVSLLYAAGLVSLGWNLWQSLTLLEQQRTLTPVQDGTSDWPSLDIVIPVKDEEANIAECIESTLAQAYPKSRITVVNDRSTDRTAEVVQALQDRHPNLRRVDITDLPEGLYGKPHGLHQVSKDLNAEFVAFVDSDLHLQPACLATLVHHLESDGLDWVATMGAPRLYGFWERLIIPLFGAIAFAWYDPRKISDPEWPDAIGSALMVCRRDAYEAIGGHKAVIDVYDEDSELIRIAKRAGQKVSFVLVPELFTQRHYGSLANTVRGLTRTCIGGIKTVPRLLMTIIALNFVALVPLQVCLLLALATLFDLASPWMLLWLGMAAAHFAISTVLARLVFKTSGADQGRSLLHPIGCAVLIAICARATVQLIRGTPITWRGTTVRHPAPSGTGQPDHPHPHD